jgi:hypothetical protein
VTQSIKVRASRWLCDHFLTMSRAKPNAVRFGEISDA